MSESAETRASKVLRLLPGETPLARIASSVQRAPGTFGLPIGFCLGGDGVRGRFRLVFGLRFN